VRVGYHTVNAGQRVSAGAAKVSSLGFHNAIFSYAIHRGWGIFWLGHQIEFPGTKRIEAPIPPKHDITAHELFPWEWVPDVDIAIFRWCDVFYARYAQLCAVWEYLNRGTPVVIWDGDAHFKSEQSLKEIPGYPDKVLPYTRVCGPYPAAKGMHRRYFESFYPYQRELEMDWDGEEEAVVDLVYVGNCYDRASIHRYYGPWITHEVWGGGWQKGERTIQTGKPREKDEPNLVLMGPTRDPLGMYRRGRYSIGVVRPIYESWGYWTPRINEVTQACRAFAWDPKLRWNRNIVPPELLDKLTPEGRYKLVQKQRARLRQNTPERWWHEVTADLRK